MISLIGNEFRSVIATLVVLVSCLGLSLNTAYASSGSDLALQRVAAFTSSLAGGRGAEADAMLTTQMRDGIKQMGVADSAGFWIALQSQFGKFIKAQEPYVRQSIPGFTMTIAPCEFEKGIFDLQISVNANGLIGGFQVLPHTERNVAGADYANPSAYTETPVSVGDPQAPVIGLVTTPKNAKSFPIVVMLTGSGPNDMDETVGPNKPFKDLAAGLATAGVATLRFDKRTLSYPTGAKKNGLLKFEYLDDAAAAIHLASTVPGATKVILLGHSEGAMLAPAIAKANPGLAGIVCLAGPVTKLVDLLVYQFDYLVSLGRANKATADEIRSAVNQLNNGKLTDDATILGAPVRYYKDLAEQGNPAEIASSLGLPLFLAFGARDYQVPPTEEALWMKLLSGKPWVSSKIYTETNHLMMLGKGAPNPDEYNNPGHVNGELVRDLSKWILSL